MTFHWWYLLIGAGVALIAFIVYLVRFFSNPLNYR